MPGIFDQIQMLGMKDCRVILKLEMMLSFFREVAVPSQTGRGRPV